jgi:thiamine biosynthesis lipoprotein
MNKPMTRRIFLQRSSGAAALIAFLPISNLLAFKNSRSGSTDEIYYEHTILAMGTTARLGVYARSEKEANHAINKAFTELKRLESLLTIFDPSSEISKINAGAGEQSIQVSTNTFEILKRSTHFNTITNGAFDITVEPLMRLWGFRNAVNTLTQLPTSEEVHQALQFVGTKHLELDERLRTVALTESGCKLDLGGIAVGYALDKMKAILIESGITDAFLDISGDIMAMGRPKDSDGWQVAIPDPNGLGGLVYQTLLKDEALATSGNYMSFVLYEAKQFGHIMDPREGRSADRILSSTVIAKSGTDVDALSTASFVSGTRFGSEGKFVFVDRSGSVRCI